MSSEAAVSSEPGSLGGVRREPSAGEIRSLRRLDPKSYSVHPLHDPKAAEPRDWLESNCYVDLWIEILHALGLTAEACFAFPLAVDFEGDQWTFFKPPLADLRDLYGIQVEELNLWRTPLEHTLAQVERHALVLIEADSYYLPDTAASDYRQNHTKTTIGVTDVLPEAQRLLYFHNAGFYELSGSDFDGLFRVGRSPGPDYLLPYCEIAKISHVIHRSSADLLEGALAAGRKQRALRPRENPFRKFAEVFPMQVAWMIEAPPEAYHGYAFSTLRQCGASFELLSYFVRWCGAVRGENWVGRAEPFRSISAGCKMLLLKLARIANSKKMRDLVPPVLEMAEAWERGMTELDRVLDR